MSPEGITDEISLESKPSKEANQLLKRTGNGAKGFF
jgi:hypothetical protein